MAFDQRKLNASKMAKELRIDSRNVRGWLKGDRGPNPDKVLSLAELLGDPTVPSWWDWPGETPTPQEVPTAPRPTDEKSAAPPTERLSREPAGALPGESAEEPQPVEEARQEEPQRRRRTPVLLALLVLLLILGAAASLVSNRASDGVSSGTPAPPDTPSSSTAESNSPGQGLVEELSDFRGGAVVYADTKGSPVPDPLPKRIPFGESVQVKCKAPNATGAASVTALYLIAEGRWKGTYVVTDSMTNGFTRGADGSPNVDPRVPDC